MGRSTMGHQDWEQKQVIANHAKFFIVDDLCYYIGSQNLYIANLAEWGIIVDDEAQTRKVLEEYWRPMWNCSYKKDPPDCNVDEVMNGLDINRDGKDASEYTAEQLDLAEQIRYANDGGGTAKGVSLAVLCKRASDLKNSDLIGKSDPYCDIHIEDAHGTKVKSNQRTSVVKNNLNPAWNEVLIFEGLLNPRDYVLKIKVMDEDTFLGISALNPDDELGEATVSMRELKNSGEFQDFELQIQPESSRHAKSRLFIALNTLGEWGV